jgi:hypothetical protein
MPSPPPPPLCEATAVYRTGSSVNKKSEHMLVIYFSPTPKEYFAKETCGIVHRVAFLSLFLT